MKPPSPAFARYGIFLLTLPLLVGHGAAGDPKDIFQCDCSSGPTRTCAPSEGRRLIVEAGCGFDEVDFIPVALTSCGFIASEEMTPSSGGGDRGQASDEQLDQPGVTFTLGGRSCELLGDDPTATATHLRCDATGDVGVACEVAILDTRALSASDAGVVPNDIAPPEDLGRGDLSLNVDASAGADMGPE